MFHRTLLLTLLVACSGPGPRDDATDSDPDAATARIAGAVQKGPFVIGSTIEARTLDAALAPTGAVFAGSTMNDRGEFSLQIQPADAVELEGAGFYYNEVTGALSQGNLTLRALVVLGPAGDHAAYVNLLTHLTAGRVRTLVLGGASFADAVAQAEGEVVDALAISTPEYAPGRGATAMNLLGGDDDDNAYLLAASAVLAQVGVDRAPGSADAELQALINGLAADLADDGAIEAASASAIAAAALHLDVVAVKEALAARLSTIGSDAVVPDLERVLDQDGDGVANLIDVCDLLVDDQADRDADGRGDACDECPDTSCPGDCVPRPFGWLQDTCVTRCDADRGCDDDAACVDVPWPGAPVALCVTPCAEDGACVADGATCGWWSALPEDDDLVDPTVPVCVPRPLGLTVLAAGESCAGDPLACDAGLVCATFGHEKVCAPPCDVTDPEPCGEAACVAQSWGGACPNVDPAGASCRWFDSDGGWQEDAHTCADGHGCVFSDRCDGGPDSCCMPLCAPGCDVGSACVQPSELPIDPVCVPLAGLGEPCRYLDECGPEAACFDGASASSSHLPGDCRSLCDGPEDCTELDQECLPVALGGASVCAVPEP